MLKRLELYADAALLSFPISLVVVLLAATLRLAGALNLIIPAAVIGGILAIWLARMLHHAEIREPLTRDQLLETLPMAVAVALIGVLLASQLTGGATGSVALWVIVSVPVLLLAMGMFVDAIFDIVSRRQHKVDDVVRVLLIGLLVFSWLSGGIAEAWGPGVGPWVVSVTAYMLFVAAAAFGWDAIASKLAMRSEQSHGSTPAPTA